MAAALVLALRSARRAFRPPLLLAARRRDARRQPDATSSSRFVEQPEPSLSTIRVVDTLGAAYHDARPQPAAERSAVAGRPRAPARQAASTPCTGASCRRWTDMRARASSSFGVLVAPSAASRRRRTARSRPRGAAGSGRPRALPGGAGAAASAPRPRTSARFGLGRAPVVVAAAGWIVAIRRACSCSPSHSGASPTSALPT